MPNTTARAAGGTIRARAPFRPAPAILQDVVADSELLPVLQYLRRLVEMPTESLTPNRMLIDWSADYLRAYGATVSVIEGPDGRANLLASLGPVVPGGLLLSGHTDVVPAGTGWRSDPYTVTESDGMLFGRGTADMKGFVACLLAELDRLDTASMRKPLHIALSYDEEVGCVGVRSLIDQLAGDGPLGHVRPDFVLIGEPTMMRPRHAHLGKVAYRLVFNATAGHSGLSPFLPNAISAATKIMTVIDAIGSPFRARATRSESGEGVADVTVNVGTVHGGSALNVLSEVCELTFELRHSFDHDPDVLLRPLWEAVAEQRTVLGEAAASRGVEPVEIVELARYPALATDTGDEWVRLIERIADRGNSASIGFGTEGGLFADALHVPVIVCGPGDIAVAHKPDEYVETGQLLACSSFLRALIDRVTGDRADGL